MVFGGFVNGYRVDELYRFKPTQVSVESEQLAGGKLDIKGPKPRTSHASGFHDNHFYVYGGQDDDNNKLGDMWVFDCTAKKWTEIPIADGHGPVPRSGHTIVVDGQKMFIFGGIFELTKELNDMVIFDFMTHSFTAIGDSVQEIHSPDKLRVTSNFEETSASKLARSPLKRKTIGGVGSPYSPLKMKQSLSPHKTMAVEPTPSKDKDEKKKDGLSSPTSISMRDSFIIKNAD